MWLLLPHKCHKLIDILNKPLNDFQNIFKLRILWIKKKLTTLSSQKEKQINQLLII